ncbi:MAG TPA: acyl-protein synthetase [Bryobacteraceae bacterium]|nr:acyl-protein synthetase [Bryobacteraceae bacterium]
MTESSFQQLAELPQYSLPQQQKESLLLPVLNELTDHHRARCAEYDRLVSLLHPSFSRAASPEDIPFIPVGLFKTHALRSIPQEKVFKTLTSSGTTGQQVSQIFLDQETARRQTMALGRIMTHILGSERLPMLVIDSSALVRDRLRFSARAAGVLGMMNFGRQHCYALDEEMNLDETGLTSFLEKFGGKPFLIFGFTFMVWQYFFERIRNLGLDLSQGILVHSGGWKKLAEKAVSNAEFRRSFEEATRLKRIFNFYGMVEQVGSVYVEGEDGFLYPPNFADVIVRDPVSMRALPPGEPGLIQVLSALPLSYPGHSILTEDLGVIHAIDNSACGRHGKAFSVIGRLPKSELRGCSDTHAVEAAA